MNDFAKNQNRLEKQAEWLQIFLKHIRERTVENHVKYDEGYKFKSVDHFMHHIDLEAPDLAGNLDQAILTNNLVSTSMYFPKKMLLIYAAQFPQETKNLLFNLFNEDREITERIDVTKQGFDDLEKIRAETEGRERRNTYIGLRFISLLLSYHNPNRYNALKPAEWKVFARFIDPEFSMPNKTPPGNQYEIYSQYIEPLREYLISRPEIKQLKDRLTEGLTFKDDEYRWVTQDVIFVTARALAEQRSNLNLIPHKEYSVPNAVIDSKEDEAEETDFDTGFMAYEQHLEEYVIKNWNNINFGEKLRLYYDEDGTTGQQYTTDVGIIDILALDENNDFVVIELKRAETGYRAVGQVLNYMGWVQDKLAKEGQKVRGMVVVGKADKTLLAALKPVSHIVSLREYKIRMELIEAR